MTIETISSHDLDALRALNAVRYRAPAPELTGADKLRRAAAALDAVLLADSVINPKPMLWQIREDIREGLAALAAEGGR